MKRRDFLLRAGVLGCSAAASPLLTPITLASAPWDNRLVVILLRGAMDGLDVVQPYGDVDFAARRPTLKAGEAGDAMDLDGFFSLNRGLRALGPLWQAGELSFAHAVSTPYRNKRSHFDGQDMLEAGGEEVPGARDRNGWLNRLLQVTPGVSAETTYAIGQTEALITAGPARTSSWSPDAELEVSPQVRRLLELVYHDDPLFKQASDTALDIVADLAAAEDMEDEGAMQMAMDQMGVRGSGRVTAIAEFAASRLRQDTRIASFSIGGWDTHAKQGPAIRSALGQLSDAILTLKAGLGPDWAKTTVIAMTEFGRTAHENGSRWRDDGTGGAMVLAGGAIRGGRVHSDWPGLGAADLYEQRDLRPTRDVRAYAGWAMRGMFGDKMTVDELVGFRGLFLGRLLNPHGNKLLAEVFADAFQPLAVHTAHDCCR